MVEFQLFVVILFDFDGELWDFFKKRIKGFFYLYYFISSFFYFFPSISKFTGLQFLLRNYYCEWCFKPSYKLNWRMLQLVVRC